MDRDAEIRAIAYQLWKTEGQPADRSVDHWLQAEVIWEQRQRGESKPKRSRSSTNAQATETEAGAKRDLRSHRATPAKSGVSVTKARRVRKG